MNHKNILGVIMMIMPSALSSFIINPEQDIRIMLVTFFIIISCIVIGIFLLFTRGSIETQQKNHEVKGN